MFILGQKNFRFFFFTKVKDNSWFDIITKHTWMLCWWSLNVKFLGMALTLKISLLSLVNTQGLEGITTINRPVMKCMHFKNKNKNKTKGIQIKLSLEKTWFFDILLPSITDPYCHSLCFYIPTQPRNNHSGGNILMFYSSSHFISSSSLLKGKKY